MTLFQAALLVAALLCSLVAGMLFTFAIVVMPGIGKLDDGGFIRAFQVIDRVIQNRQPLFALVWVGSALAIAVAAVLGIRELGGMDRALMMAAAFVYIFGVQLPTIAINVPMNNELQRLDPGTMNDTTQENARSGFELRWNRWNAIRTVCAIFTAILLLLLLLRG